MIRPPFQSNSSQTGGTPPEIPLDERQDSQNLILLTPPPIWSRILIWTLSLGSLSLLIWSCLTNIDETVSLPGQLETLRSEVSIKSPESAVVNSVPVRQYQIVKPDQILFILSTADISPRIKELQAKLVILFDRQVHEQASLNARLEQTLSQVNLNREMTSRLQMLVSQGSVQEVQLLESKNALFQSQASYESLLQEKSKSAANYRLESTDIIDQIRELKDKVKHFVIKTPLGGSIQHLAIQASGQRVAAGELLATVVPQEDLIAAVSVPSKLAAPLKPGTVTDITVDAFPATDYGTLKGVIETISPTTMADSKGLNHAYTARIRIQKSIVPKTYPIKSLKSGMGLTARMILYDKPVISLVFDFVSDMIKPMADRR
jgi:multidrug resistance efflux pump